MLCDERRKAIRQYLPQARICLDMRWAGRRTRGKSNMWPPKVRQAVERLVFAHAVLPQTRSQSSSNSALNGGLLLLRGAALVLALTFGWRKFRGMLAFLPTGQPWNSWDLAVFLHGLGFPAPVFLSLCVVVNEWLLALAMAAGFFTRFCSACLAAHMAIAFYVSFRLLTEEPMRAALYFLIFITIASAGPGEFSIDYAWRTLRTKRKVRPDVQPATESKSSGA